MPKVIESIWSQLRAAAVVLLISCMIWYAADQNVTQQGLFDIAVRLESSDPDVYAAFSEFPFVRELSVKLNGSRRNLDEFEHRLTNQRVFEIHIDDIRQPSLNEHTVSAEDAVLARIPDIGDLRLSVVDVTPENLSVRIDRFGTLENRPIKVLEVEGEPSPKSATIRLPRFLEEKLRDAPLETKNAKQRAQEREPNSTGEYFEVKDVEITLPGIDHHVPEDQVKIIPSIVTVTVRRGGVKEQKTLPIPVYWGIPNEVLRDYSVVSEHERFVEDITVGGPSDELGRLQAKDVAAYINVKVEDTNREPRTVFERSIDVFFTAGFRSCTVQTDPLPRFRFHLEPRNKASPSTELDSP